MRKGISLLLVSLLSLVYLSCMDFGYAISGGPPGFCGIAKTGTLSEIDTAIKKGADIEKPDKPGSLTPLMWALLGKQKIEVIELLIKAGANVNAVTSDGSTVLSRAVANGSKEIITLLLSSGAKKSIAVVQPYYGTTVLCDAAYSRGIDILQLLLDAGADIKIGAPLCAAAYSNTPEVVLFLIKAGAEVNAKDFLGDTPLLAAARHSEYPAIIDILLDYGAKPEMTYKGKTAFDYASENKYIYGSPAYFRLLGK
jgi:ankyrin repeat protein